MALIMGKLNFIEVIPKRKVRYINFVPYVHVTSECGKISRDQLSALLSGSKQCGKLLLYTIQQNIS